ncbi:hypothetical protein niasHS_002151 [Heterodera schachtii]|uniref:GRIP domain-containing protein n=1 Tax=Heterodera schachtii TaxID=97005 RepID=A0ABD2KNX8_HETSC
MPSVTNLPGYLSFDPSHRTTGGASALNKLGGTSLHHRGQCHSNPQLNFSSPPGPSATLSLPISLQQRHSTGSLTVAETPPRKGILKRPHTFNLGRERPSAVFPRSFGNASPAIELNRQQKKQLSEDHEEKREGRKKTAEEAAKGTTQQDKGTTQQDKGTTQQDKGTTTQRVEFADKNAVAIFGDTTTDTEAGADGAAKSRKTRKNATAIVSPVVREQRPSVGRSGEGLSGDRPPPSEERGGEANADEVSHIVGKWWFGRSTKFVVHCDRRGSSAGQSSREGTPQQQKDTAGEEQQYLTPTQRKQREISALKKELRRSQLLCRDKERHLGQLKERLDEIERLMASSSSTQLVQCARLEQRLAERENEFMEEKEALTERHEHRIRQMNQEMTDLRTELARREKTIDELSHVGRRDRAVQVDMGVASDCEAFDHLQKRRESNSFGAPLSPALVPATALGWAPPNSEKATEYSESVTFGGEEKRGRPTHDQTQKPLFGTPKSASPARGPSAGFQQPQKQMEPQLMATLEAYRSETVVWRTRTAQLELILQDLLLREGAREAKKEAQKTATEIDEERERETKGNGETRDEALVSSETSETFRRQQIQPKESVAEGETLQQKQRMAQSGGECQRKECVEGRHRWEEEKQRMEEKLLLRDKGMAQMEEKRHEMSADLEQANAQLDRLRIEHAILVQLAETRLCEIKAIQMALNGAQAERDKLEQALAYIERRCHVMEQIGLDQGIVLVELDDFRPAPGDVFTFRGSKGTQTMLTAKALGYSEKELDELQIQIRSMQMAFAEDKATMSDRLKDIEQMLTMKTELVTTLTVQLENAAKNVRSEDERHQRERDAFTERVAAMGRTTERVPILENELERARGEKSLCELRMKRVEAETDERMEKILAESMRNSKQNEEYWAEKCGELERRSANLAAQLKHEKKAADDERMGWQFSRIELDRRLHSAIEHASILNARLNCPRRDAQCDVRPRTLNKYVTCRPNQLDKGVGVDLDGAEMEHLRKALHNLESDREWLRAEMDKMGREMAERIEKNQQQRNQKKTVLPDLTVTFHRGKNIVQLGGGHPLDTDNELEEEEEGKTYISVVSLPAVFDHSEASLGRPIDQTQIKENLTAAENNIPSHCDLSLQLSMSNIEKGAKHAERSHSEPIKSEEKGQVISHQTIVADANSVQQMSVSIDHQKHDAMTNGHFEALREQMHELLSAILSRGSSASESATTAQRETKSDKLLEQLGWWLRTMADGDKCQSELRRRAETLQREKDQLREQLRNALAELEVYRTEPRRTAWERWTAKTGRSSSAEQLDHGGRPPLSERQLCRWKQIAGTTFREVNQLRKRLTNAETDRLSLLNRLAILRGELAMEKCQRVKSKAVEKRSSRRRGSVDRLIAFETRGETLASYNRWLGGDRWQSVPELDDEGMMEEQQKRKDNRQTNKGTTIVLEALKRQLADMRHRTEQTERARGEEIAAKSLELTKVRVECELLKRENRMYEEKCDDMDRERQQMYLIMFRKGQQAANMEMTTNGVEDEVDKASELQVVLRFLHDAFFYYLLNKGNATEHMQAIMTMLNFTAEQKEKVYRGRRGKSH